MKRVLPVSFRFCLRPLQTLKAGAKAKLYLLFLFVLQWKYMKQIFVHRMPNRLLMRQSLLSVIINNK